MDYYSGIAKGYNELYLEEQKEKIELACSLVEIKGLVLDIGGGTGVASLFFDNLVVLDPNVDMLERCSKSVLCVKGSAESIPFEYGVFDAVISFTALHHCDIDKTVKEIKRVSAENCVYAFSILKKASNFNKVVSVLKKEFDLKEFDAGKDVLLI